MAQPGGLAGAAADPAKAIEYSLAAAQGAAAVFAWEEAAAHLTAALDSTKKAWWKRTVILAARIAAQARAGETLVSDATSALVDVPVESSRQAELKGLAGRYTLHVLAWRSAS